MNPFEKVCLFFSIAGLGVCAVCQAIMLGVINQKLNELRGRLEK